MRQTLYKDLPLEIMYLYYQKNTNLSNKKEREYPSDNALGVPSHRDMYFISHIVGRVNFPPSGLWIKI
jgi:hypothetical protein